MEKIQPQIWVLHLLIGTAIVIIFNNVGYFVGKPVYQPDLSPKDFDFIKTSQYSPTDELSLKRSESAKKKLLKQKYHQQLQKVIFSPGNIQSDILKVLGEPTWKKSGFWKDSIIWSYENVVIPDVDIDYIFDTNTNKLRQVEISFSSEINLETKRLFLELLTNKSFALQLQKQIQAVHQGQNFLHNFRMSNLAGVVRRNHEDRIFIEVWEEYFH